MLKEGDLVVEHYYIAKNPKKINGFIPKRCIIKLDNSEGYVVYVELKALKNGAKGTLKTVSIPSFLRWAGKDITGKAQQ